MGKISETQKGELFIYASVFLWSFFPIITVLTFRNIPSFLSLAYGTLLSSLFFAFMMSYRRKWHELKNIQLWKNGILIALYIGVLFYGLYFTGLTMTTPGNAVIIGLFEVFSAFIFFNVLRGEHIPKGHIIGGALMVIGAGLILIKDFSEINIGDLFIFLAVCTTPIGNMYQQRARKIASSESVLFVRTIIAVPALFLLAYVFGAHASFTELKASFLLLAINGIFLLGLSKIFWIEAIHRISVTKGEALSTITPFLTLILAWIILKQTPTIWQLSSLPLLLIGSLLLTDQLKIFKNQRSSFVASVVISSSFFISLNAISHLFFKS